MRMRAATAFLFPVAVILASGLVAGAAAPVLAQMAAVKPAEPNWDQLTDRTLAAVQAQSGLTDDQVRQIRPLLRAHLPRMRSLFESYAGSGVEAGPSLLKQYQETRAAFKTNVDPILTEPQRKQFEAIRAEFDVEMKKAFVDARLGWFERVVGADAGQSAKLRPILTESFEKRLQLFAAVNETRDPLMAGKGLRIQLQNLQGETDARLKTVLTPEQMGKYQDSAGAMAPADAKPQTR